MVFRRKPKQSNKFVRRICGIRRVTFNQALKVISAMMLPLILGIFTIVISFEQHSMAREQRLEDRNELQQQRKQELDIANMQREIQQKLIDEQRREQTLANYMEDMGELLEKSNGSLMSSPITSMLARVKSLNAIRQLDGSRNTLIIRFLYETSQLTNTDTAKALDISTALLTKIDASILKDIPSGKMLSLSGVILYECMIHRIVIENVNFSFATLKAINLSHVQLININFSFTTFKIISGLSIHIIDTDFSFASFLNVSFPSVHFIDVNCSNARLTNTNFSLAHLANVTFAGTHFIGVNFYSARLVNVNFQSSIFNSICFSCAELGDN
jgi:uncharacterized protein YjbI with pentapeptide repeats